MTKQSFLDRILPKKNSPEKIKERKEQEFFGDMILGMAESLSSATEENNKKPDVSVRLKPQVPFPQAERARSWFGGNPSLPHDVEWPKFEGKEVLFLAQICCENLPQELWGGIGPRTGWLVVFIYTKPQGAYQTIILHTPEIGHDRKPAATALVPAEQAWFCSPYYTRNTNEYVRSCTARVPVQIIEHKPEDPEIARYSLSNNSDPLCPKICLPFNLALPEHQPFDQESLLLIFSRILATYKVILEGDKNNPYHSSGIKGALRPMKDQNPKSKEATISVLETYIEKMEATIHKIELLESQAKKLDGDTFSEEVSMAIMKELIATKVPHLEPVGSLETGDKYDNNIVTEDFLPVADRSWTRLAEDLEELAKHKYFLSPDLLPQPARSYYERLFAFNVAHATGAMGNDPLGFTWKMTDSSVVLLELPSNTLTNWIWGDTYNLLFLIEKDDLANGNFDNIRLDITN